MTQQVLRKKNVFAKQGEALIEVIRSIEDKFLFVAVGIFFLLMLISAFDVMGRYLFNHPIVGTIEFSKLMVGTMVLFSWGYLQRVRGHVRLDLIVNRLSPRVLSKIELSNSFLFLAIFGIIVWRTAMTGIEEWREGIRITTPVFLIASFPFQFLVSVMALFVCFELIIQLAEQIRQVTKRN